VHDLSKELDLKEFDIKESSLDNIKSEIINEKLVLLNQINIMKAKRYLIPELEDNAGNVEKTDVPTQSFKTNSISSYSDDNICLIDYRDKENISCPSEINGKEELRKSPWQLFSKIFTDIDILFIMASTFFGEMIIQMTILILPVVVIDNLDYTNETVNIIMAIQLVGFLTLVLILHFLKLSLVNSGILSWILNIAFLTCALMVSVKFSYAVNVFLLILVLVFLDVAGLKVRVFLSVSLSTLVQSKHQSFMDSIRIQVNFFACLLGAIALSKALGSLQVFYVTSLVIMVVFLALTWYRRNVIRNFTVRV